MVIPTIPSALQPNLPGQPRARHSPGAGAAMAEVGGAGMNLAVALKRRDEEKKARDRDNALREARAEAAEKLGALRARSDTTRAYLGLTDGFNAGAEEIRREVAERFADDEETAERFGAIFEEMRVPHAVGVVGREMALRVEDDRMKLERDANRMLREYAAAPDEATRDAIAAGAAGMIDDAAKSGLITPEQAAAARGKFTEAVERGEWAAALRTDPAGFLKAIEAGKVAGTPVELEQMKAQAVAAIKAREVDAERTRLDQVEGQLRVWLRDDPATGADELAKPGALGLDDGAREQWRTQMLREVEDRRKEAEKATAEPLRATALDMIDTEPERFLDMEGRGFFDNVPPAERARMKIAARGNIERRTAAEKREADRVTTERHAMVDAAVDVAEKALFAGRPLPDPDGLLAAAAGTPSEARMKALVGMDRRAAILRGKPASERVKLIGAVRAGAPGTSVEAGEVEMLTRIHTEMRKAEEADIWKFREDNGYGPAPAVDFGDPQSLRVRLTLARKYAAEHEVAVRFFSEAEAAALQKTLADGSADIEDKLAILTTVAGALGNDASVALAEIGMKSPVYGRAGFLLAYGGDPAAAAAIVSGHEALKAKEGPVVPGEARDLALAGLGFDRALPKALGDFRTNIIDAARAHYAGTMRSRLAEGADEITDRDKRDAFSASVNAALGARTERGQTYGGIQEVNGWETVLPPGLSAAMVENMLKGVPDEVLAGAIAGSGALPVHPGGQEVTKEKRGELVLRVWGPNLYHVGHVRNGEFIALRDKLHPNRPAVLDLGRVREFFVGSLR